MAGGNKDHKISYSAALWQGFENLVGAKGDLKEIKKAYATTESYCDQVARAMVSNNSMHVKRMAANSATTMDEFMSQMESSIKSHSEKSSRHLDQMHEKAISQLKKAHGSAKDLPQTLFGKAAHKGQELGHSIVESLLDVGRELGKLAPAITAFGSLALAMKTIIDRIFELDQASVGMSKSFGGNLEASQHFIESLSEVVEATRLSKHTLIELGNAFQQAGIPIIGNTKNLHEYMTVAGNLNRILGTSFENLAKYTMTLKASGASAEDVFSTYDEMYQSMQRYQLTLADLNASMTEGDALWSSFGSVSGKTLDHLQKDILDTKGMFKAFNIDVKNTGSLLAGIWGDPKVQMRQAGLISSMMKMRGSAAYNEILSNPKQAMQDLLQSSIKFMSSFPAAQMGKTFEQLQEQFSSDQLSGILHTRQALMMKLSSQFGIPQDILSQAVSDFTAFKQTNPRNGIDDWTGKRLLNSTLPGKPGSLQDALSAVNNSVEGTMAHLNNAFDEIIDNVAMLATKQLPALMKGVNSLVDGMNILVRTFNPGQQMKSLTDGISSIMTPGVKNLQTGFGIAEAVQHSIAPSSVKVTRRDPQSTARNLADPKISKSLSFVDSKELNVYRKAQGLGTRGLHKDFMQNAAAALKAARSIGADPTAMIATMIQESGGNAKAAGDGGHSIGLFQLNDWGKGRGIARHVKEDPFQNALIAGKEFEILKRHHPTWSAGHIAAAAQRPQEFIDANKKNRSIDATGYARSVNAMIPFAQDIVKRLEAIEAGIGKQTDVHTEFEKNKEKRLQEIAMRNMAGSASGKMQQHYVHNSIA